MNDGRNTIRECVLKDNLVPYTFENFQIFLNQKMGTIFYLTLGGGVIAVCLICVVTNFQGSIISGCPSFEKKKKISNDICQNRVASPFQIFSKDIAKTKIFPGSQIESKRTQKNFFFSFHPYHIY